MNFAEVDLDPEQQGFRDGVRAFLDEHLTDDVYEDEWETGAGHNAAFHRALGDRGWILPRWPREQGGARLTHIESSVLDAELSARNAPMITKGTTSLVLPAVVRDGDPHLAEEIVRGVARGEICVCLGYTEPDVGSDLAAARTRALRDGDEWVIDGQKMFTTGAQNCQYAFLVTRTNPDVPKHKGLTMFLCPLRDTEIRAIHTLGGERTNMVFFDGARVSLEVFIVGTLVVRAAHVRSSRALIALACDDRADTTSLQHMVGFVPDPFSEAEAEASTRKRFGHMGDGVVIGDGAEMLVHHRSLHARGALLRVAQ